MKQTFTLLAALFFTGGLMAQVVPGTIGEGTFTGWEGQTSTAEGIDFNNDSNLEFTFSYGYDPEGNSVDKGALVYAYSDGGCAVATVSTEEWDHIKNLTEGTQIGSSTGFYSQGDAYVYPSDGATQYVGFRILIGTNVHYGWAKVTVTEGGQDVSYTANWVEAYYQSTPGTSINVGQRSSTNGVKPLTINNTPNISIATKGCTITVSGSDRGKVYLYDIAGRLVDSKQSQGVCKLQAPKIGVYIVRTEHFSRRIMVR